MDLVEFLRARLDEDEALARGAEGGKGPHGYFAVTDWAYFDGDFGDLLPATRVNDSNAWSPARVLAEVEAKRRIIELHGPMGITPQHHHFNDAHLTKEPMVLCRSCEPETMWRRARSWPCRTLRLLALPYADAHPDYQPEWKL